MEETRTRRAWVSEEMTKEGDPIYVLFRYGKVALGSFGQPRIFYSPEHYKAHRKKYGAQHLPDDRLVKYVPAEEGEGGCDNG